MSVLIRCLGLAGYTLGDQPQPALVGQFLAEYDPEKHDGMGEAAWTPDREHALRFDDAVEAWALWTTVPTSRPVRPDGQPNKPLTAFTIEIVDDTDLPPLTEGVPPDAVV